MIHVGGSDIWFTDYNGYSTLWKKSSERKHKVPMRLSGLRSQVLRESVCVCARAQCVCLCVRDGALALDKVLCQLSAHWSFHC